MDVHEGEHPRIGAVDVIPFIPLGDTTIDACIDLARAFGERIATRFDIPVYLYARAATRPDREKLADVRRGQYEGLRAEIGQRGREPDFGPAHLHPSAGAVAVGARPFLIAYNINLDTDGRRACETDRPARARVGRWAAAGAGQWLRGSRAGAWPPTPRPGLDEPARLHRDATLGGLGRGPRPGRGGRRGARGVRAHRARAAGRVPGRRRPGRSGPRQPLEERLGRPRRTFACATSRRRRRSSFAWRKRADRRTRAAPDDQLVPRHRGRPHR